jgi:glycosyltransferase involved in cell wall biosynthesis
MKFSIITVNYNNREGLAKTIKSVVNQTSSDYEFIIIDGGSNDGSQEVIKEYSAQITYWVSEHDKGIYNGMNKGIAKARGTYVNFMNSGDIFYDEETLEKVSSLMDDSDFIIGKDYNKDPDTGEVFTTILPTRISMAAFYMWTLPHQSAFIRRSLFENSPYDESLRIVADWKFYMDKIVYDGKTIQLLDLSICNREQEGISISQATRTVEERHKVLSNLLPPGIYKDYETLAKLDRSTLYKLLSLLDQAKSRKWLTYFIKALDRIVPSKSVL